MTLTLRTRAMVHCFGVCNDEIAVRACPLLCLQRQVAKRASELIYCWSLLRSNTTAINLQTCTSSHGIVGVFPHVTRAPTIGIGRRAGGFAPWILKFSAKKVVFVVSSGKKQISPFLPPPTKFFERSLSALPGKIVLTPMSPTAGFFHPDQLF